MDMIDIMAAKALCGEGGGGGFTPTDAQLTAMNSGINSTKVEQIETNKTNILNIGEHFVEQSESVVALNIYDDGYYTKSGVFTPDTGRLYAIVSVEPEQKYKVSTFIKSTLIAGVIYRNDSTVLSYDLVGTGTEQTITDYEIVIPDNCNNIILQSASYLNTITLKMPFNTFNENCDYKSSITVYVGDDILDGVNGYYESNSGWSGNKSDGYTHASGYDASMSFSTNDIETNAIYILEFDTTYDSDEFVKVGIGDQYRILCYNSTTHISIPLLYTTGNKTVYFTPISARTFTITNIKMYKINGGNTERTLNINSVFTKNHTKNYGYWNTLLGKNVAENAVGATRTIAIGYASMNALQGGHRNIGLGTYTLSQMTGGENNIAIGADSMLGVKSANNCISIGKAASYNGLLRENDIAIGNNALFGNSASDNSKNNVAIGNNAGWNAYGQDNVFIGYQAGYQCKNTNGNVCIGKNAYGAASGNHNTCIGEQTEFGSGSNNSIAIGYNVKTTASNQLKIGNASINDVIFCGDKRIKFNNDGTVTWETVT